MWRNLNLRARILFGYGAVLALAGALAIFLVLQVGSLNQQIAAINASSAAEAEAGTRVAASIAAVQQAVDSYLRRPSPAGRAEVERAFADTDTELAQALSGLSSAAQRQRHAELARQLAAYYASVQELSTLLDAQDQLNTSVSMSLFEAAVLASHEITGEFVVSRGGLTGITELSEAQQSLQLASRLISRALADQDQPTAERALVQVVFAHTLLERNAARPAPSTGLLEARDEAGAAVTTLEQLADTIGQVRTMHDTRVAPQSTALRRQADAIAAGAVNILTDATTALERQVNQTQQVAGLALLFTVLFAILFGRRLANSLAQPLDDLARAVDRVNGGDYEASVSIWDGGEIGRLAESFNQMTGALRRQREEVRAQHAATAARNYELEQILADLQAATAARDTLAGAVRALSVPVVPILKRVIAVPLVGEIDAERAAVLLERVLAGITAEQARVVILDITGVPFVDAGVAGWLVKAAAAAELLGARCVLTGISPEVAQALVTSGAELGQLVTRADMRAGVEYALGVTR